jgi:type VI protein secretion system component VasF
VPILGSEYPEWLRFIWFMVVLAVVLGMFKSWLGQIQEDNQEILKTLNNIPVI